MEPLEVVVRAGQHHRHACPVWVQLPKQEPVPVLRMTEEAGAEVPCQAEPSGTSDEDRLWLTWIVRDLAAGQERRYRIEEAPAVADATDRTAETAAASDASEAAEGGSGDDASAVSDAERAALGLRGEAGSASSGTADMTEDPTLHRADPSAGGVALQELEDGRLSVHIGGEHFTTYYFGSDVVRPYFHPLVGPTGEPVTRGFPMVPAPEGTEGINRKYPYDHPHHRSFWVAHGDVNGADNWSEGAGHATQRHGGFSRLISGPVYGSFDETVEWMDRDGRAVLLETRRITFFNIGGGERLFDVSLRFNANAGTVTFGDTKEGGLIAVRVASSMDAPEGKRPEGAGKIENAYGGTQEAETWGKRANWCDYSGPVGDARDVVGICMMDHPTNPRYPTHWHVRAYGLMTANPFGLHDFYKDPDTHRGDWTIPAYESRNFLYRVLIHRGDAREGDVRERYHDFVNLPAVELVS
jgi:hypothetical protein